MQLSVFLNLSQHRRHLYSYNFPYIYIFSTDYQSKIFLISLLFLCFELNKKFSTYFWPDKINLCGMQDTVGHGWDLENHSQVRHEKLPRANLQQWMKIILHDSTTGANLIPQPGNLPPEAIMEHLLQCSKILCWLQLQYLLEAWENYYNFLSGGRTMLNENLSFSYLGSLKFLHTYLYSW